MSLFDGPISGQPMAGWVEADVVHSDHQLVVRRTIPANGLSFAGAIDASNVEAVRALLAMSMSRQSELHLELSKVQFIDVSGIRAIASAASAPGLGGKLVLHGLPEFLKRVMTLIGWDDVASISLCDCTTEVS